MKRAVTNSDARERLTELMDKHGLDALTVATMTFRKPQTIRAWRCGARRTPAYAIRMIETIVKGA